jgi:hypothetical protein
MGSGKLWQHANESITHFGILKGTDELQRSVERKRPSVWVSRGQQLFCFSNKRAKTIDEGPSIGGVL